MRQCRQFRPYCSFNSRTREGCDLKDEIDTEKMIVSIHAPARGAILSLKARALRSLFQFTHPRGVRCAYVGTCLSLGVSIHAPARGAICRASCKDSQCWFQFTHPRGVRLMRNTLHGCSTGFNSRTREGCDLLHFFPMALVDVSIHAPARGAMILRKAV